MECILLKATDVRDGATIIQLYSQYSSGVAVQHWLGLYCSWSFEGQAGHCGHGVNSDLIFFDHCSIGPADVRIKNASCGTVWGVVCVYSVHRTLCGEI